jgi:DnaB-like helicase C terminal domain
MSETKLSCPPLQFRAAARKLVVQHGCRLLVVDYVQLMEPSNRTDSRERQVAECSRTIPPARPIARGEVLHLQLDWSRYSQACKAELHQTYAEGERYSSNDDGRSRESRANQNGLLAHSMSLKRGRSSCPTSIR